MRALWLLSISLFSCNGDEDDRPPADSGVPDGGDTSVCETWIVDYDLAPAQFDIRGTPFGRGDGTNAVGPGHLRLSFPDDDGAIGTGAVTMLEFMMRLDFTVSDVHTEIDQSSGPEECGIADGAYDQSTIAWQSPLRAFRSQGTVTCNAGEVICAFAGLPNGTPDPRDSTHDQDLMPFIFTSSTSTVIPANGFIMDYVQIPNDDAGDTFLRFTGNETARICVRAPTCP